MPQPSKGKHVLKKLRLELGWSQVKLAKTVGLHERTIQDIEHNILKLSRRNAMKISEATGVSTEGLMHNDSKKPILNTLGKPWTREDVPARSNRWNKLTPETRRYRLAPIAILLGHYLEMRDLIDELDNPFEAIRKWEEGFERAVHAFIDGYAPLQEKYKHFDENAFLQSLPPNQFKTSEQLTEAIYDLFRSRLSVDDLQEVEDDIRALKDAYAYEHPISKDPAIKDFWRAVITEHRPLNEALKTLQPEKKK